MKAKIISFILFIVIFTVEVNSQTVMYSNIVDKDIFQLELASFQTTQKNDLETSTSWSLPSALFRYGLNERVELQMVTPFNNQSSYYNSDLVSSNFHIKKVQLGIVLNLLERNKIIPETSLTYRSIIPFNKTNVVDRTAHLFSLNLSNKLSNNFNLNYNFRYLIHSNKSTSKQYVSNFGYSLNKKLQVFVENNGEFSKNELVSSFIIGGLSYVVMDNLFLNLHYGKCVKQETVMVGGILTWRFKTV